MISPMVFPDYFSVEGRFAYFCHFFPGYPLGIFAGVRKFSNKHRTTKINLLLKAWRRVLLVFQQLVPNCVNGDFKKNPRRRVQVGNAQCACGRARGCPYEGASGRTRERASKHASGQTVATGSSTCSFYLFVLPVRF